MSERSSSEDDRSLVSASQNDVKEIACLGNASSNNILQSDVAVHILYFLEDHQLEKLAADGLLSRRVSHETRLLWPRVASAESLLRLLSDPLTLIPAFIREVSLDAVRLTVHAADHYSVPYLPAVVKLRIPGHTDTLRKWLPQCPNITNLELRPTHSLPEHEEDPSASLGFTPRQSLRALRAHDDDSEENLQSPQDQTAASSVGYASTVNVPGRSKSKEKEKPQNATELADCLEAKLERLHIQVYKRLHSDKTEAPVFICELIRRWYDRKKLSELKEFTTASQAGFGFDERSLLSVIPLVPKTLRVLEIKQHHGIASLSSLCEWGGSSSSNSARVASSSSRGPSKMVDGGSRFDNLENLTLCFCRIDDESIIRFANALKLSKCGGKLKSLDLRHNSISDSGLEAIISLQMDSLTYLNISSNKLNSDAPGILLKDAIRVSMSPIPAHLRKREVIMGMNPKVDFACARIGGVSGQICQLLKSFTAAIDLQLMQHFMRKSLLDGKLEQALRDSQILESISLPGCNIGDDGIRKLAESLAAVRNLKRLNLSANDITEVGAKEIAWHLLSESTPLQEIHLATNDIGDIGFVELVRSGGSKYLKLINLEETGISSEGVEMLSEVFEFGGQINWAKVRLGKNLIGSCSAVFGQWFAADHSELQMLFLNECFMNSDEKSKFLSAAEEHGVEVSFSGT